MKNEFSFAEPLKNKQEENYHVLPADDKQRKYYMVVFYYKEGDTKVQIVRGQYNTRMTIINNLDFIDIDESFVLVEDVGFGIKDGKPSVYTFLKWIEKNYDDGFNIDEYIESKREEQDMERHIADMQSYHSNGGVITTYQDNQINDMLNPSDDMKGIN